MAMRGKFRWRLPYSKADQFGELIPQKCTYQALTKLLGVLFFLRAELQSPQCLSTIPWILKSVNWAASRITGQQPVVNTNYGQLTGLSCGIPCHSFKLQFQSKSYCNLRPWGLLGTQSCWWNARDALDDRPVIQVPGLSWIRMATEVIC